MQGIVTSEHVPGPWEAHEYMPELWTVRTAQFQFDVAVVGNAYLDLNGLQPVDAEWHPDVVKANAYLIAAAPILLEALGCLTALLPIVDKNWKHAPEYREACAAIAKACGREVTS